MIYQLSPGQNVFLELTNSIHGGEGWDFGEALWSPTISASGGDVWKTMRKVKPGDLIIHSLKRPSFSHQFYGTSFAKSSCIEVDHEPPIPGRWAGSKKYYKILLQDYSPLPTPLFIKDFLNENRTQLKSLGDEHSFYERTITKPAQKYLVPISRDLFSMLERYFENRGVKFFENILITDDEDSASITKTVTGGTYNPQRVATTVIRTARDTKMIRELKVAYSNKCQICGRVITLPNGSAYSEGHHLQKLGSQHQGPDIPGNIIILCPYHHAEFDYGAIGIDDRMKVVHINTKNECHGRDLAYQRSDLDKKYIKYHMDKIYNK